MSLGDFDMDKAKEELENLKYGSWTLIADTGTGINRKTVFQCDRCVRLSVVVTERPNGLHYRAQLETAVDGAVIHSEAQDARNALSDLRSPAVEGLEQLDRDLHRLFGYTRDGGIRSGVRLTTAADVSSLHVNSGDVDKLRLAAKTCPQRIIELPTGWFIDMPYLNVGSLTSLSQQLRSVLDAARSSGASYVVLRPVGGVVPGAGVLSEHTLSRGDVTFTGEQTSRVQAMRACSDVLTWLGEVAEKRATVGLDGCSWSIGFMPKHWFEVAAFIHTPPPLACKIKVALGGLTKIIDVSKWQDIAAELDQLQKEELEMNYGV